MPIKNISSEELKNLDTSDFTILNFHAKWSINAMKMKQELSKIASEYESFDILAFNIEDDLDLAHSFGVKSVPSLFIVNNNKIIGPKTGLFTNNEIKEWINNNLNIVEK